MTETDRQARGTVLITGASMGFGRLLADDLARRGHTVFGAARSAPETTAGWSYLPLDVRDPASVRACVAQVAGATGRIDAVVNNAGYVQEGALEEVTAEGLRAQFETNVFGVARVVDAVLPCMRSQGAGRIVNVSSLAGLIPLPFLGAYCASKHALDSYSESLYHELLPLNIAVSIVAPGHFDTGIAGRKARPAAGIPSYDAARTRMYDTIARDEAHAGPPDPVVRLLAELVEGRRRGLRHVLGPDALMHRVRRLLPDGLWARGMRLALRID